MNLACKHRQHEMRTNGSNWTRAKRGRALGGEGVAVGAAEAISNCRRRSLKSFQLHREMAECIRHFILHRFPLHSTRDKQNVGHFKLTNQLGNIAKSKADCTPSLPKGNPRSISSAKYVCKNQ